MGPHRCLVTNHGGTYIRPLHTLGRHIRLWRQANNAHCAMYSLQHADRRHFKNGPSRDRSGPHIHGSLDPHKSATKWHLNWFSHFCIAHP